MKYRNNNNDFVRLMYILVYQSPSGGYAPYSGYQAELGNQSEFYVFGVRPRAPVRLRRMAYEFT